MVEAADRPHLLSILLLEQTWATVRRPMYRLLVVTIFLAYGFVALLVGQMLILIYPPENISSFIAFYPQGHPWWNYPALLVVTPDYILALPFFATIAMAVVSFGVGIGMTSAVYLGIQLFRARRRATASGAAKAGPLAGVSPALIGLVTLGACCSTTAAALAGLTWTAIVVGTTVDALLINNWYPAVFQIGVLYLALVAQEQLIRSYRWLFAAPGETPAVVSAVPTPPLTARRVGGYVARGALLVGGATWILAVPAEWASSHPPALTAAIAYQVLAQHVVPGVLAVAIAVVPAAFHSAASALARRSWPGLVSRGALVAIGLTLVGWLPATVASQGAFGWGNELLGVMGVAPAWGAIVPPFGGLSLAFRWGLQFLLMGGLCISLGIWPAGLAALGETSTGGIRLLSPAAPKSVEGAAQISPRADLPAAAADGEATWS